MKTRKIRLMSIPLLVGMVTFVAYALATTQLAPDVPYIGDPDIPVVCGAVASVNVNGEVDGHFEGIVGDATFQQVGNSPPGALTPFVELTVVNLDHLGNGPIGPIHVTIDQTREATSRIEAINPGTVFPARSTRVFYPVVSFEAQPDVEYRSIEPITFVDENLTEWPQHDAVYNQVGTTDFERTNEPGTVALTLSNAVLVLSSH